jgi:hypothetical protein
MESFVLRSPDGREFPLVATEENAAIGPLDRCGVWSIVPAPADRQRASTQNQHAAPQPEPLWQIACNLANPQESDLRPKVEEKANATPTVLAVAWGGRPIWFYLVALALVLAGAEWFLYQRRWIS